VHRELKANQGIVVLLGPMDNRVIQGHLEPQVSLEHKEIKDHKVALVQMDHLAQQDPLVLQVNQVLRDHKDLREPKDKLETSVCKEKLDQLVQQVQRDSQGQQDQVVHKDHRDRKDQQVAREMQDLLVHLDPKDHKARKEVQVLQVIGAPVGNQGQLGQSASLVTQDQLEIQVRLLLQDCQVMLVQVDPLVYQVHQARPDLLDHEDLQGTMASKVTLDLKDPRDNRAPQEM